jgi:hypothetical protein
VAKSPLSKEERAARKPIAYEFEEDGLYVSVEFTRDNGERVAGSYRLIGWELPPADVAADFDRRMRHPIVGLSHPRT